jgi:glycerophosphoryl diester phosphodiesterase
MARFLRIAHRGASGLYPENTRLAFEKAIESRADMIELDCQLSADGHVVVFHDEDLRRTAGVRGAVRDQSLAQLKALDIGRWRNQRFSGERVLTLEEALEILQGRAALCLEIKQFPHSRAGIELKLLFILSHYDFMDRTTVSSFVYRSLSRIRELAPDARIGVIYAKSVKEDPFIAAAELGAESVHVHKEAANTSFVHRAWEQGLDVFVWTINDAREIEGFAAIGVQGIISDYPERLWIRRRA